MLIEENLRERLPKRDARNIPVYKGRKDPEITKPYARRILFRIFYCGLLRPKVKKIESL